MINPVKIEYLDKLRNKPGRKSGRRTKIIQVGNSASITNNHLAVLDLLAKFKDEDIKLCLPLSYGNPAYAQKVVEYGRAIFRDKLQPLLEYLPPEEYGKVLADVDVAVFGHRRQEGGFNVSSLIYLGKKVYIMEGTSQWDYLKNDLGIEIYNTNDLANMTFAQFSSCEGDLAANRDKIKIRWDEKHLRRLWAEAFKG
jgi:hypothetical protein